jgi:hypothetical protein
MTNINNQQWGNLGIGDLDSDDIFDSKINTRIANREKNRRLAESGAFKGEKNPMYGRSAYNEMSADELENVANKKRKTWENKSEKERENHAKKIARYGEDNGMYGNGHLISGERNGFYNKSHTDETKQTLRWCAENRVKDKTCEHCGAVVDSQTYGTHHGKYCKQNPTRVKRKCGAKPGPQEVVKCPHCHIEGGKAMLTRYHGDNCFMNGYHIQSYIDGKKHKLYKTYQSIVDDGILFDKVKLCCLGKKASVNGVVYKLIKKGK